MDGEVSGRGKAILRVRFKHAENITGERVLSEAIGSLDRICGKKDIVTSASMFENSDVYC